MRLPDGGKRPISRELLAAVLQSLITAEIAAARGRRGTILPKLTGGSWSEEQRVGEGALRCDSIEAIWLQAAVNEMFHLHEVDGVEELASDLRFGAWLDTIEGAWRLGVARITFSTSGSTGKPKRCTHAFNDLETEVHHLADLFAGRRRIVAAAPPHHIYGFLLTALLPDTMGIHRLDVMNLAAGGLATELGDGDLIVTFPEKWAWIERSLPVIPPGVAGVVSTAPCPPSLIDALIANGLQTMTDIYGSSETAGVAIRRFPGEDRYTLMPHWRLVEEDCPILVRDDGSRHLPPDRLEIQKDGGFRIAGRRDGAVQVGGINVWPTAVAERLRSIPGVAEVVVRKMREDEGNRLKAFIVPTSGMIQEHLRRDVEAWIEAHLPAPQRPMSISFGTTAPVSGTGKPKDW